MKKIALFIFAAAVAALALLPTSAANGSKSFILGDADGNGKVDVNDASLVQSVIAEFTVDADGSIAKRADFDGNGLSVEDATLIQRYLAEYEIEYNIGETVPEQPSENTTETPPISFDEYELPIIH